MKTEISKFVLATLLTCPISAATVSIADFEQTDSAASGFAITVVGDGNDWLFSFTRTGDLDGLGNSNDTLSFDLRSAAFTGSSFDGTDITLGTPFDYTVGGTVLAPADQHFGSNYDIDTNQTFQLSIENISYTSGDGGPEMVVFNGFSSGSRFGGSATADYYFGTTNAATIVGGTFSGQTFDVLTITSSVNNSRYRDMGFSFEVVPEPATSAMLIGGIALMAVRRRRE